MLFNGSLRPWREIAQEIVSEHDHNKILKLTDELNKAITAQGFGFRNLEKPLEKLTLPEK